MAPMAPVAYGMIAVITAAQGPPGTESRAEEVVLRVKEMEGTAGGGEGGEGGGGGEDGGRRGS